MSDLTPSPKRHRGGQPGNINALKHGFYTRRFSQTDLAGVESTDYNGLRILCLASITITRLVKTSQFLQSSGNSNDSDLHMALVHLTSVLKLDQLDTPLDDTVQLPRLPPP